MEIAALVLGIVSFLISFIPVLGLVALIPAVVGLILGIVAIVNKAKEKAPKGMAITGTILSSLAMIVMIWWIMIISMFATSDLFKQIINYYSDELDNYEYEDILELDDERYHSDYDLNSIHY